MQSRQAGSAFLLAAWVGVMLCSAAWAQQGTAVFIGAPAAVGPSGQNETPADPGTISGTVLSSTGEAMDKASVRLLPGNMRLAGQLPVNAVFPGMTSGSTDASGNFTLRNVSPGSYQLMVQRNGFVTQYYGAREPGKAGSLVTVSEGEEIKGLEIVLYPQAVVAGQITDEDGDPVQGVQVSAVRTTYAMGQRRLLPVGTDTTDDQGNYRIPSLPPGRYFIEANPRGGNLIAPSGAPTAAAERMNLTTYFPNALRQEDAAAVNVTLGQQLLGTNIRLRKEPVFSISGKVVDRATDQPVEGAEVRQVSNNGQAVMGPTTTSGRDGSFTMTNVPAGSYTLQVSSGAGMMMMNSGSIAFRITRGPGSGQERDKRTGSVDVTVGNQNIENVTLEVAEGNEIHGTVLLEGGDIGEFLPDPSEQQGPLGLPALGAGGLQLRLAPTVGFGQTYLANFEKDGSFTIEGVAPGRYFAAIDVRSSDEIYVKSVRMGGQDITNAPVDLLAGGGDLEVVLAKGAATLTGTLIGDDGEPLPGRQVSVWPKIMNLGRSDSGVQTATTDQNGTFKVTGMIPGDYFAVTWDGLPDDGLAGYPPFLHAFESGAEEVKLSESAEGAVQVKLIGAEAAAKVVAELP